jgi:hypothetical protein
MSQQLTFLNPAGDLTLDESEIVAKNLDKIATGIGDARVDVPQNDAIIPYVQRQDRITYDVDGETVFTGYAVGFQGNEATGQWTLRIDGIGKRLEETRPDYDTLGGPLVYTNIGLDDAIRDYWGRTPFSADVTDQDPEVVATDEEIQSADTDTEWGNVISLADTEPLIIQNGNLELAQTSWTTEGENFDSGSGSGAGGINSDYSGGEAVTFDGSSGDVTYQFTTDHTIPEDAVSVYLRFWDPIGDGPAVDVSLDGTPVTTIASGTFANLEWADVANSGGSAGYNGEWTGGDLSPGTHDLRLQAAGGGTEQRAVDVVAPLDNRFTYTFDNDNGGSSGYLDGPELFPGSVDVTLQSVTTAYNITEATVTTTWNDTSGNQAIAVSNDNGANFLESTNTSTDTFTFNTNGREAITRFTLSRYGSRTTATPQQGYLGQAIDGYSLTVDLTNRVVIDRLELSRDHFSNLKTLHDYGDFLWNIAHDSGDLDTLQVNSFSRGQEVRTSPAAFSNPENIMPEVAAESYFNSIYLEGALQDDGTRPTAEVKLEDQIAEDGREITPGVLRDQNISTDSGAQFRANALLATAQNNNDLRGTIDTYPVFVQPAFAYPVDFGDGTEEKTLESVSITESAGQISASYKFVIKEQLAQTIDNLKRDGRDLGNQV